MKLISSSLPPPPPLFFTLSASHVWLGNRFYSHSFCALQCQYFQPALQLPCLVTIRPEGSVFFRPVISRLIRWSPVQSSDLVSVHCAYSFNLYLKVNIFHRSNIICRTPEETYLLSVNKASGAIRCLFTNTLTKKAPLTWSHVQQYVPQCIPLDSLQDQGSWAHSEFSSHWRRTAQSLERVCVCVCVYLSGLSTVAQSSVGFAEFPGVAGFTVLLRASLSKVLSLNCERICC